MKILCVDDNVVERKMIDLMLAPTGLDIDFARHGADALEAYQHSHYDVIMLDMDLSALSGLQLAQTVRRAENSGSRIYTPILFFSRHIASDNAQTPVEPGYAVGGDGYLIKPFTSEALIGALDRVLRTADRAGLSNLLRAMR